MIQLRRATELLVWNESRSTIGGSAGQPQTVPGPVTKAGPQHFIVLPQIGDENDRPGDAPVWAEAFFDFYNLRQELSLPDNYLGNDNS